MMMEEESRPQEPAVSLLGNRGFCWECGNVFCSV